MNPLELVEAASFVHTDGKYTAVLFDPSDFGVTDDTLDLYNLTVQKIESMMASGFGEQEKLAEIAATAAGETIRSLHNTDRSHAYVLIFEDSQARKLLKEIDESIAEVLGGLL